MVVISILEVGTHERIEDYLAVILVSAPLDDTNLI